MNKRIFNTFFLLTVLGTLAYFINNAKIQNSNFYNITQNIQQIILLNKDLNLYLKNTFKYNNFDIVQNKIISIQNNFKKLQINKTFEDTHEKNLINLPNKVAIALEKKFEIINKINSHRAILNKSYIIIQKLKTKDTDSHFDNLYTKIMTLDKNPAVRLNEILQRITQLQKKYSFKYSKFFLKHCKLIVLYNIEINKSESKLNNIGLEQLLIKLQDNYNMYSQKIIQRAYLSIIILFILLLLSLLIYIIYDYRLVQSRTELKRFRKTVENSDNIIVITDEKIRIKYVNTAFTNITGYTLNEVKGKNPKILSSGNQSKSFYDNLNQTIYAGKKWSGEFINVNKNGDISYEQATITPVYNEKNRIIEFIAIKLDTTKEKLSQDQLHKKEKLLLQQSKMAAMGEMLQNISHQWRQPLSLISTASTGLLVKKEMSITTTIDEEIKILNTINDATQHLSETINAFRDFFNPNKEKTNFKIGDVYKKTINIIKSKFKSVDINLIENIDNISITNLDNELIQVLMNLLNNARDVLVSSETQNKLIFINIYQDKNNVIISVKDNGGGIDKKIINKVFEPYFTTKHQSDGTGIGLYMCQEIISKHMNGKLTVTNQSFIYQNINYKGAEFKIIFPKR